MVEQIWRAKDGTLFETEAAAKFHEKNIANPLTDTFGEFPLYLSADYADWYSAYNTPFDCHSVKGEMLLELINIALPGLERLRKLTSEAEGVEWRTKKYTSGLKSEIKCILLEYERILEIVEDGV